MTKHQKVLNFSRTHRSAIRAFALCTLVSASSVALFFSTARGDEMPPVLDEASQAIDEDLPQVAIAKLQAFLDTNPPAETRMLATQKLARALIDAEHPQEALSYLRAAEGGAARLLKAEAFGAENRWPEALFVYRELASQPDTPWEEAAALGEAESLHAQGRMGEAINVLQKLTDRKRATLAQLRLAGYFLEVQQAKRIPPLLAGIAPRTPFEAKWKKYIEGRMLLAQDQAAPALAIFEEMLKEPRGLTESLFVGATIGAAETRVLLNGLEVADNVLEDFIWQHPESAYLGEMFARLDQFYAAEENPSDNELQRWVQRAPPRRAALALFYYARALQREKKMEKTVRALNDFARQYPDHPLACDASALLGKLQLDAGKLPAAVAAFESAMRQSPDADSRARTELALGVAYFKQREFLLAANTFRDAARRSEKLWQTAVYNAALAWLNLGNYNAFLEDYQAISQRAPDSEMRRDLLLEEGLLQARRHDSRAVETLQLFVRDFADHPRVTEAKIALAEIAFLASDVAGASKYLKAAYESSPAGEETERADYLALFLADAAPDRDDEKVITLGKKFLAEHGNSALKPEVRMKLGQVYFRREDFSNAQTQFELIASEAPTSPLAETALFLAGQSAMRSMNGADRALELFERVAKLNGPLKFYARQEQAIAKTQTGKASEAIILYDDILRGNSDPMLRFAALCGKADNLAALAATDPQSCEKAIIVYDQLASEANATRYWKDQALYKKAKCLDRLKKPEEALTVFYDVLQTQTNTAGDPEYFWYYKAGFDLARTLESREQWKAAASVYEKIAKVAGPRAEEAKMRAEQLRLEHFIWD
jgi:tetratricopeptide (TPR) repeat protein